jgi:hypothetical protein
VGVEPKFSSGDVGADIHRSGVPRKSADISKTNFSKIRSKVRDLMLSFEALNAKRKVAPGVPGRAAHLTLDIQLLNFGAERVQSLLPDVAHGRFGFGPRPLDISVPPLAEYFGESEVIIRCAAACTSREIRVRVGMAYVATHAGASPKRRQSDGSVANALSQRPVGSERRGGFRVRFVSVEGVRFGRVQ